MVPINFRNIKEWYRGNTKVYFWNDVKTSVSLFGLHVIVETRSGSPSPKRLSQNDYNLSSQKFTPDHDRQKCNQCQVMYIRTLET
jgi:hypothetical protein